MMNCWQNEPEARPSFADLTQQLKGMEKQHKVRLFIKFQCKPTANFYMSYELIQRLYVHL